MERLDPVKPEVIERMRHIIDGIRSGKYTHVQSQWHCNTAHCFAGWNFMIEAGKLYPDVKDDPVVDMIPLEILAQLAKRTDPNLIVRDACSISAYTFTLKDWDLTCDEGDILFDGELSLSQIEDAVSMFEQGYRYIRHYDGHSTSTLDWIKAEGQPVTQDKACFRGYCVAI